MVRPSSVLVALALVLPAPLSAQPAPALPSGVRWRAPDGVAIDELGRPHYATFSLCAIDPAAGQAGAAVTTRVPFVGRAVPWVRAGVGAVCTQALTVVEYGARGLDLMAQGIEPGDAIARLLADDAGRESRQLGLIDMQGRTAAHTGTSTFGWSGSRQGKHYTVQANIMVGPDVIDAVATAFEATEGSGMPLAERMILAIEAGQAKGGDSRWGNLQSAAIRVADPKDPGRGNDFITLAIQVDEHPEPVAEMKRIYYTTQRRLGYRTFSQIEGPDVVELKRMLHALGYWRPALSTFPEAPSMPDSLTTEELRRTDFAKFQEMMTAAWKAVEAFTREYGQFDGETVAAVDRFRADQKLAYMGNPPGLVDERFVSALRAACAEKRKAGGACP